MSKSKPEGCLALATVQRTPRRTHIPSAPPIILGPGKWQSIYQPDEIEKWHTRYLETMGEAIRLRFLELTRAVAGMGGARDTSSGLGSGLCRPGFPACGPGVRQPVDDDLTDRPCAGPPKRENP